MADKLSTSINYRVGQLQKNFVLTFSFQMGDFISGFDLILHSKNTSMPSLKQKNIKFLKKINISSE